MQKAETDSEQRPDRVPLPAPLDLLGTVAEPLPAWLASCEPGEPFPRDEFFRSRVVYYPGSGDDGHPLRLFGRSHAAHCFVFADYLQGSDVFETQLLDDGHRGHPRGYRTLTVTHLVEQDLAPWGWRPHLHDISNHPFTRSRPPGGPYALWALLERIEGFTEDHGPERLALLIVGGEGVATYDALFCQKDSTSPYAVLIQDHGFGCNWTRFGGADSPLLQLAARHGFPEWAFIGDNGTEPWPNYHVVSGPDSGGMHNIPRRLYRRD